MNLDHGQEARFDPALPDGAEVTRAANWELWPLGVAGVRFEDEHRLSPIVQGGPRPGVALLSGLVRVVLNGMTGELRRFAHVVVGDLGVVGLTEMQGEAVSADKPERAASKRAQRSAPEPAA